jgi:hypothetical protein
LIDLLISEVSSLSYTCTELHGPMQFTVFCLERVHLLILEASKIYNSIAGLPHGG